MGSILGKSKRPIYKKIQVVIEYQGHKYDKASLKALATWINSHQLQIPDELNLEHWDNLGAMLWKAEKKGDKIAAKALIAWRLVYMLLQDRQKTRPNCPAVNSAVTQDGGSKPSSSPTNNEGLKVVGEGKMAAQNHCMACGENGGVGRHLVAWDNEGGAPHRPEVLAKPQASSGTMAYRQLSIRTSRTHHHTVTHIPTRLPKQSNIETQAQLHPPTLTTSVGEDDTDTDGERETYTSPLTRRKQKHDNNHMQSASAPRCNTFSVGAEEGACAFPVLTATTTHETETTQEIIEVQEKAWKVVHEQATLAGDLDILKAFPVHYEEGRPPQWRPISYPVSKDIKKAITEHDLSSPYALSLLESFFNAFDLTPNDIRQVASACSPNSSGSGSSSPSGNSRGSSPGGNSPGSSPGSNSPGGNSPDGNSPGSNSPGSSSGGNSPGGSSPVGNSPGDSSPGSKMVYAS
ncbi:hypothetical protein WISP_113969 [Willisornis vidua]|uniref:Uncharacterized protein n=1 Tax=Willisornis vidua TaxID=1566151 RepID=A0ABQ9CZV8_9PASS|nr:hypothetical protein WISP_113969 [Willisornis vidua]